MVWEAVEYGMDKYRKIPRWPNPFGQVKSIEEVMCNEDYWIAEITMLTPGLAKWFWTTFVPQPSELFRKTFTGSYKCGFYLNIKVKSPVTIIFGGTSTKFLAMIVRPFATGAFALWATQIAVDALHAWSTSMSLFGLCEPRIGNYLVQNKSAPIGSGSGQGAIPGGNVLLDVLHQGEAGTTAIGYGPGRVLVRSYFIIEAGGKHYDKIEIGHMVGGSPVGIVDLGPINPGERLTGAAFFDDFEIDAGAANSWIRYTGGVGGGLADVLVTLFMADVGANI